MKEMIKRVREERGGFTLAELLIVVAIVLVLAAIAIPIFTGVLNSATTATQNAEVRSIKATATSYILDDIANNGGKKYQKTGPWKATANVDGGGTITDLTIAHIDTVGTDEGAVSDGNNGYTVTVYITDVKPK